MKKTAIWLGSLLVYAFAMQAQSTIMILPAEKIIKLIPDKLEGLRLNDEVQCNHVCAMDLASLI